MIQFLQRLNVKPDDIIRSCVNIAVLLIVMAVSVWVTGYLFRRLERGLKQKNRQEPLSYLPFFKYLIIGVIYYLCGVEIISQIGPLQSIMKQVLAGSGIAAVIIGFASQDAVSNVASGLMISIFKPFKAGDVIRYIDKDITGVVEQITLRHTIIKTFENKRLIVPNGTINKEVIENFNYADEKICTFVDIGITFDSDVESAIAIIAEEVRKNKDHLDNRTPEDLRRGVPEVVVRVLGFENSAVTLRAAVWTKNILIGYAVKSDLLKEIKKHFEEKGIKLAYPHRTVTLQAPEPLQNGGTND